jgi:hypothetical protein
MLPVGSVAVAQPRARKAVLDFDVPGRKMRWARYRPELRLLSCLVPTVAALVAGSALVPSPLLAQLARRRAAEPAFRWESLGPSARVAYGTGGNSLVVMNRSEALLVDTKVNGWGQVLDRETRA